MAEAPYPINEPQRLASLNALGILYTPAEERYDRITRLTSRLLSAPIVLVSLVSERCQWFKSKLGLEATETPREVAFCAHAILDLDTFVVEDATADERFAENPLVTGTPDIRFYAGHPVCSTDGMPLGTLCIIDRAPREFGETERQTLRDFAALVEAELQREQLNHTQRLLFEERDELRRKASIDGLTRAWNREATLALLRAEIARAERGPALSVAMIDVDVFKAVNDEHGHQAGDRVLTEIAARIRSGVRDFDIVGRYGGDEFVVVLGNCDSTVAKAVCDRVNQAVSNRPVQINGGELNVSVSIGLGTYGPQIDTAETLLGVADQALYRAKEHGRNRVEVGFAPAPGEPTA